MKLFSTILILISSVLFLDSCIKHEVIPAPVARVDLNSSLEAVINGTDIEWTQNVNGFKSNATVNTNSYPSPTLSQKIYKSQMSSIYSENALRLTFGLLSWDAAATYEPSLSMFNDFHKDNADILIPFKDYDSQSSLPSLIGVEVEYTDNNGIVWISRESDPNQFANFEIIKQESDITGDYSLFSCQFSCKVWRINPQTLLDESIMISNAQYKAWFKR
jgi:hypothetical protein